MLCKVRFTALRFMDAATTDDARDAMAEHLREELDETDISVEVIEREDAAGWPIHFVGADSEAERRVPASRPPQGSAGDRT